jgi:hypothetical protein
VRGCDTNSLAQNATRPRIACELARLAAPLRASYSGAKTLTNNNEESERSACNLHLTLLDPSDACGACGFPASDHSNHPINRPRKELAESATQNERLRSALAVLLSGHEGWTHERIEGSEGFRIRVERARAEALDGTIELRLTEDAFELVFIRRT